MAGGVDSSALFFHFISRYMLCDVYMSVSDGQDYCEGVEVDFFKILISTPHLTTAGGCDEACVSTFACETVFFLRKLSSVVL